MNSGSTLTSPDRFLTFLKTLKNPILTTFLTLFGPPFLTISRSFTYVNLKSRGPKKCHFLTPFWPFLTFLDPQKPLFWGWGHVWDRFFIFDDMGPDRIWSRDFPGSIFIDFDVFAKTQNARFFWKRGLESSPRLTQILDFSLFFAFFNSVGEWFCNTRFPWDLLKNRKIGHFCKKCHF